MKINWAQFFIGFTLTGIIPSAILIYNYAKRRGLTFIEAVRDLFK